MTNLVSNADFALYLNDTLNDARATFILGLAQTLCESIVTPLPAGAEVVVFDVAERAYANPLNTSGNDLTAYAEGLGPYSQGSPGTVGGGLYLTQENQATLRRLAGSGGAFTIDTTPVGAGLSLPWWDTGVMFPGGDWDTPA